MKHGSADVLRARCRGWAGAGLLILSTLLTLSTALPLPVTAAEPTSRIQIVFDGSGSMWGRLAGDSGAKYALAREALRQALPSLDRSTEVGLMLFGHRRRGDCSDVEQAVALQPVDSGRLVAPLETLNPKGRGPLTLALVAAADVLPGKDGNESLILIHDDPDNCQGDPCATAAQLSRVRPRLAVHIVSIGMKPDDLDRMSCVPRLTGGRHFDVKDATGVAPAVAEALRLASLKVPEAATQVPRPRPATRPDESGLRLTATLSKGGDAFDQPIMWRVFPANESSPAPIIEVTDVSPRLTLAAGSYVVEAHRDLVTVRQPVDVAEGRPARVAVVLNAGVVQLAMAGSDASSTALISLQEQPEGEPAGRVVWLGPAAGKELLVPAGSFKVTLQDRQFRAERIIVVPSGSRGAPPLASGTGRIRVEAQDHAGSTARAERVLFRVLEDDPAAPGGRREVARSAAVAPQFTLQPGTYHLVGRKGAAEVRELIALRPGDNLSRKLDFKLARLSLSARLPGSLGPQVEKATYRVLRLAYGTATEVARAAEPAPQLQLPAGRYRIEARLGRINAVAQREIELVEASQQQVVLEPAAALLQLRAVPHGGGDIFWEVRDSSGHVVWRTAEQEPRDYLAPGRYTVRAENRERHKEVAVELRPGDTRTLDVALE